MSSPLGELRGWWETTVEQVKRPQSWSPTSPVLNCVYAQHVCICTTCVCVFLWGSAELPKGDKELTVPGRGQLCELKGGVWEWCPSSWKTFRRAGFRGVCLKNKQWGSGIQRALNDGRDLWHQGITLNLCCSCRKLWLATLWRRCHGTQFCS